MGGSEFRENERTEGKNIAQQPLESERDWRSDLMAFTIQGFKEEVASRALDKNLPSEASFDRAAKAAGIDDQDGAKLRKALIDHMAREYREGSLTDKDLEKAPRVGAAYVATGALTEAEHKQILAEQENIRARGGKPPRYGEMAEQLYKDQGRDTEPLRRASKFYDALMDEYKKSKQP